MGKKRNKKNIKQAEQPKEVKHDTSSNQEEIVLTNDQQDTTNSFPEISPSEEVPTNNNIQHNDLPPLTQALVNLPPYVENTQQFLTNAVQDDYTSGAQNHNPSPAPAQPPSYAETVQSLHQNTQHQPPPSIVHPPSYEEALQSLHQEGEGNARHQHYHNPTPPPSIVHQPHFDHDAFNQAFEERTEGVRPKGTKPSWVRGQSAPIHDDDTLADFECSNLPQNRHAGNLVLPESMMFRCYKQHMQLIKLNGNSQNMSYIEWCSMYRSFFQYFHDNQPQMSNMNYHEWLILNHETLQEFMYNHSNQIEYCLDDFQWDRPYQMNDDDVELGNQPQPAGTDFDMMEDYNQVYDAPQPAGANAPEDEDVDNYGRVFSPANGGHGNDQVATFVFDNQPQPPQPAGSNTNEAQSQSQQSNNETNSTTLLVLGVIDSLSSFTDAFDS